MKAKKLLVFFIFLPIFGMETGGQDDSEVEATPPTVRKGTKYWDDDSLDIFPTKVPPNSPVSHLPELSPEPSHEPILRFMQELALKNKQERTKS